MKKPKKLADLKDIPAGIPQQLHIGSKEFLVVRDKDTVCTCGNICPHYGASLSDGLLVGSEIVCPWHGARFNVQTGKVTSPPALDDIPSYEVTVEGGEVFVGSVRENETIRPTGRDARTFVIVGSGAAGNAAAETLRKQGFAGRVILFTAEEHLPYDRPNLSKGILSGKSDPDSSAWKRRPLCGPGAWRSPS